MFALDTNVLVRLLVDDPSDPGQCAAARSFVASQKHVLVPEAVLLETVWVLQCKFGLTRRDVGRVLSEIKTNVRYRMERPALAQAAIDRYVKASVDFGDCLIHAACDAASAELVTFDRLLSKVPGINLLTSKGIQ